MPNADHATMRVNAHLSRNHTRAWRSTVSQCVEKSMANRGLCAARSAPIRTSPLFCWHYLAEVAWHRGCLNSRAACSLSSRSHTSPRLFMCARGGHQFMQQQSYASVIGLLAGALLALQGAAHAQSATIYGSVGNFDVANNQQKEAHGFEVELEGVHPEDIASTFDSQRYGAPTIVATATGTIVRWASAYDPARGFTATTAAHPAGAPLAGTCYQWAGAGYDQSGCEHFGASLRVNATRARYRWLVEDPAAPGSIVPGLVPMAVAAPAYSVAPPAVAGAMPVLNADVDA